MKKEGYLVWDGNMQRPDIKFNDGSYYGGLNCGSVLEALINDKWINTRLELNDKENFYLVGIGEEILWQKVRI